MCIRDSIRATSKRRADVKSKRVSRTAYATSITCTGIPDARACGRKHRAPCQGVINTYLDSDDEDAYTGEQKEIQREAQELRAVQSWINQEGWDAAAEGRAV